MYLCPVPFLIFRIGNWAGGWWDGRSGRGGWGRGGRRSSGLLIKTPLASMSNITGSSPGNNCGVGAGVGEAVA